MVEDTPDLPTELEIVDTFTKLIFGDETYTSRERATITALRLADERLAPDDLAEIGCYLRALGVVEMIKLVHRVQAQFHPGEAMPLIPACPAAESNPRPH